LPEILNFGATHAAAHNAAYDGPIVDRALPEDSRLKWICTWRCSAHVWPEAPGHGNQVLRYWLGLRGPTSRLPPHRALPDAQVTAQLLIRLLGIHSPEELHEMTGRPLLLRKLRFGKYRDELWADAVKKDPGYFRWVLGQDFDADTKYTARYYLDL
jgi:exodeoxyribonuclease X